MSYRTYGWFKVLDEPMMIYWHELTCQFGIEEEPGLLRLPTWPELILIEELLKEIEN